MHSVQLWLDKINFLSDVENMSHVIFILFLLKALVILWNKLEIAFVPLHYTRNIYPTISTGKISENTLLQLVFLRGICPVELTSFMFLLQPRQTE